MSRQAVQRYQNEIAQLIHYGGSSKETAIRGAFQNLLNEYCRQKDFLLVPELDYRAPRGNTVYPDGTVKDALRLSWGYWESKDTSDDLDEEIQKKFAKGYPPGQHSVRGFRHARAHPGGRRGGARGPGRRAPVWVSNSFFSQRLSNFVA